MKTFISILTLLLLVNTGCKKDKDGIPDTAHLYNHTGFGKLYTTIVVKPLQDTDQQSPAFQAMFWNVRENLRINYGGRQVEGFDIQFTAENTITLRVYYRSDTGIATATYTYQYSWDAEGLITLTDLTATNANGTNLQPYIGELLNDYLGGHSFRMGWIEDKLPGTKGTVAAFYRSDDPTDFFYGTIK